jgi:hypothetical protein
MKISKETFRAPHIIFVLYMIAAALVIMGFRFIFPGSPGEAAPLALFSRNWRLLRGLLEFFNLFPALAFSALVVPFGLVSYEDYHTSFSPRFFRRLMAPVITAICAAALYGIVFFLVFPVLKNHETNMRFKSELYRLAKERAQAHRKAGEWSEAAQFLGICNGVWPASPELASLAAEIQAHLAELQYDQEEGVAAALQSNGNERSAEVSGLPGQKQPVNAAEAIALSEAAYSQRRYYDAHWLATVGERLARQGSPEAANAARLAGRAWNQIESLAPTLREEKQYALFNLKRSGYQAMNAGDWIRAYYIFKDLRELTPEDPDAANFFAASEKGTKEVAFFIDEMGFSLGEILTGAVFSLPAAGGRAVLRFASLSSSADYAYGTGLEYLSFDAQAKPRTSLIAPYVKLLPITLDGKNQVLLQMRALDRHDSTQRWEPQWALGAPAGKGADAQITLDISFEDFLLLSQIRQGLSNLQIAELFEAAKIFGRAGYVPQVFEAEVLNRLGTALFFLPMAVFAIIIGWRFRAKNRPRYFFVLLLPVLPVVFNGLASLYRTVLNTAGIWLILTLGFSAALAVFIAGLAVSFFVSLIILAAQHG